MKNELTGGYLITYQNCNVAPGNGGSPIFITDKNEINKISGFQGTGKNSSYTKCQVGVHTGTNDMQGYSHGTLITPAIDQWMREVIKHQIEDNM